MSKKSNLVIALFTATILSTLMLAMIPGCSALTKSAYNYDPKVPYKGESVDAYVAGDYNSGGNFYYCTFHSSRGYGQASGFDGLMWVYWTVGSTTNEAGLDSTYHEGSGSCSTTYLRAETHSHFYFLGSGSWYRDATTAPISAP